MELSEFIEVYFEDKQYELKDRTIKNKRYMMKQHIISYFGEQMIELIEYNGKSILEPLKK